MGSEFYAPIDRRRSTPSIIGCVAERQRVKGKVFRNRDEAVKIGFLFLVAFEMGCRAGLAMRTPRIWPDSERYRSINGTRPFDFLSGQGPGQIVQLLNLLPLPEAVGVQAGLATALWGIAAYLISGTNVKKFLILNLFSLSPWWTVWDISVLSEAMTISGVALFAAAAGRRFHAWMVVGLVVTLLSRPMLVPFIGVVALIVWISEKRLKPALLALTVAAILFTSIQTVAFNSATVKFNWMARPATISSVQAADRLLGRANVASTIPNAIKYGLPERCRLPTSVYKYADIWGPAAEIDCPGLGKFLEQGGTPWYADVLNDPVGMSGNLVYVLSGTAYPAYYQTPTKSQKMADFFDVAMWVIFIMAMFGAAINKKRIFERGLVLISALGYAGVLWLVDGQEIWRHVLPCLAFVIVYSEAASLDQFHSDTVEKYKSRHTLKKGRK